jgi:1,4-dihydroxy-2-naphthoate octaprenyltransferase
LRNIAILTRVNFLPLTIVIVLAGLAAAAYSLRSINPLDAVLVMLGALLTHAAVNAFNNYFDYRSKIDAETVKTPFSGGVEVLVNKQMAPPSALAVSIACILGAAVLGVYFLVRMFNVLFPLIAFGAVAIVLYSPVISRIHGLSEIVAGAGFGLMGVGTYATQTGVIDAVAVSIFVPVTILVAMLLFLNEFPDVEVDKRAGRHHVVILLGRRRSAWVYVACLAAMYTSIIMAVLFKAAPITVLISVATIPIATKAAGITLSNYDSPSKLVPALGANVLMILSTIFLIAVGFGIGIFL